MFSVPPATTTEASPHWMAWAASITALRPEPQTLLTVVAPIEGLRPAPMAAWRATFWPRPAPITLPKMTSSTASAGIPLRASAALTTALPRAGAGVDSKAPQKPPMAVRAPPVTVTLDRTRCGRLF